MMTEEHSTRYNLSGFVKISNTGNFVDFGALLRRIQHVWSTEPIGKSLRINSGINSRGRKRGAGAPAGAFGKIGRIF